MTINITISLSKLSHPVSDKTNNDNKPLDTSLSDSNVLNTERGTQSKSTKHSSLKSNTNPFTIDRETKSLKVTFEKRVVVHTTPR
eukprot:UN07365